MLVSIHQPECIGYLGYYAKIIEAEHHIFLDDVQFIKRGFIQRNRIRRNGIPEYVTIPVKTKGRFSQLISEVEIDATFPWRKKFLGSLKSSYAKAPYFKIIFPQVEELLQRDWTYIANLNKAWVSLVMRILGYTRPLSSSSEYRVGGEKCERLCNLVKAVGGTSYLSGRGAEIYNDAQVFKERKIELTYTSFIHPHYEQRGEGFSENVCVLDALFNCSSNEVKEWLNPLSLKSNRKLMKENYEI